MTDVNSENSEITLEITTITRIIVPTGSTVIKAMSGNGDSGIMLPDGRLIKSYLAYEIDEKELNCIELEEAGCYAEDLSREIEQIKKGI